METPAAVFRKIEEKLAPRFGYSSIHESSSESISDLRGDNFLESAPSRDDTETVISTFRVKLARKGLVAALGIRK